MVGVLSSRAKRLERDCLDTAVNHEHPPPPGDELESGRDVVWTDNKGDAIQHTTIRRGLGGQPGQTIPIGLDLVSVKKSTHRCDIDSSLALAEP